MNDLTNLVPRDKFDSERADAAIQAGFPAIEPVIADILWWIADMNWPVARQLEPFLSSIGFPLAPYLRPILASDDYIWIYNALGLMKGHADLANALRPELERLAERTPKDKDEDDVPELAMELLRS